MVVAARCLNPTIRPGLSNPQSNVMKRAPSPLRFFAIPILFLLAGALPGARAAAILGVDFGRNDSVPAGTSSTSGNFLETGFRGFYISGAATFTGVVGRTYSGLDPVLTSGAVTVSLQGDSSGAAGNIGGRNRGAPLDSGAFTYGDLLYDGIIRTKLTSTAGEFTLQLLGLNPNTSYAMRLWSANSGSDIDTVYSWFDTTSGSNLLGTILNGPGSPLTASANTDYSVFGIVTSDAAGALTFGVTSSNGSPTAGYISGFELSTVPEPDVSLLAALAALPLLRRRRHHCGSRRVLCPCPRPA
ncbi:MAG: hypothetical protein JWL81_1749 [Verrucomicrobiales bacterium]|nr:hypothetical protein [Verrucomicrobiales bacterium]